MQSYKIVNDPIYGFITVPRGIHLELLDHPWMQRLRRIHQLGCSHLVYPGAVHSRFHHVLGAFHLMQQALKILESKGTNISEEEKKGACLAILLHDLGHGPYSHALEGKLLPYSHEEITKEIIRSLNEEFSGELGLASQIFEGKYHRPFLNQLVSSQLDMDRMDYLSRDSFYTGVAEGVISYDRITLMLNTVDDQLVIEEKGIYSLEKFLTARKLMYWQVYLHKTGLAAEKMLISLIARVKKLLRQGQDLPIDPTLKEILTSDSHQGNPSAALESFYKLDDVCLIYSLKRLTASEDRICRELSERFLNRRLFKVHLSDEAPDPKTIKSLKEKVSRELNLKPEEIPHFVLNGEESNTAYRIQRDEITILKKDGTLLPYSAFPNQLMSTGKVIKYYLIAPRTR
ncbi:MAG: HD domain-containing protein [Saprospirales bacterium]|nr:MAG: HD domain-containing protein [Saprospirales bacterium]